MKTDKTVQVLRLTITASTLDYIYKYKSQPMFKSVQWEGEGRGQVAEKQEVLSSCAQSDWHQLPMAEDRLNSQYFPS